MKTQKVLLGLFFACGLLAYGEMAYGLGEAKPAFDAGLKGGDFLEELLDDSILKRDCDNQDEWLSVLKECCEQNGGSFRRDGNQWGCRYVFVEGFMRCLRESCR